MSGNLMQDRLKDRPVVNTRMSDSSEREVSIFDSIFESVEGISSPILASKKRAAFEEFLLKGIPDSKLESWKYTNLVKLLPDNIVGAELKSSALEATSVSSASNFLVFVNGQYLEASSRIEDDQHIKIIPISEDMPPSFCENKKTGENIDSEPLFLLNTALFKNIVYVEVPQGGDLDLEIKYVSLSSDGNQLSTPRVFVKLGEGAKCNLVENFVSVESERALTNHVLEAFCGKGAILNHVKIQNVSLKDTHLSSVYLEVEEGGLAKTTSLNFGSSLTRNEVYPVLSGEKSDVWLLGANVLCEDQHVDNFTSIEHVTPNCESHELYKGIYGGHAKGIFTGTIIVREEAQKTNAYQSNASLLCSDDAESISRPQLKIWADDVKCSHGATVGQLDEEALFYLRSRGISEVEARAILTNAYVSDVLEHIEDESLKAYVSQILSTKLASIL